LQDSCDRLRKRVGSEGFCRDSLWSRSSTSWCGRQLPLEAPDKQFGLQVVILRRKLRVIWLLASSGDESEAIGRIDQLSTHYYRTYCLSLRERSEARLRLLSGACRWLRKHVGKLKVCENPKCEQLTTYFLRRWNNNKYCSDKCSQDADGVRRKELLKSMPPKPFKRSPEARNRMSESAKRRWAKHRRTKKHDQ